MVVSPATLSTSCSTSPSSSSNLLMPLVLGPDGAPTAAPLGVAGAAGVLLLANRKGPSSGSSGGSKGDKRSGGLSAGPVPGTLHSASSSDLSYQHHLQQQQMMQQMQNVDGQRHIFQENTYKKITPCDVCSQVLRGMNLNLQLFQYLVSVISLAKFLVEFVF